MTGTVYFYVYCIKNCCSLRKIARKTELENRLNNLIEPIKQRYFFFFFFITVIYFTIK